MWQDVKKTKCHAQNYTTTSHGIATLPNCYTKPHNLQAIRLFCTVSMCTAVLNWAPGEVPLRPPEATCPHPADSFADLGVGGLHLEHLVLPGAATAWRRCPEDSSKRCRCCSLGGEHEFNAGWVKTLRHTWTPGADAGCESSKEIPGLCVPNASCTSTVGALITYVAPDR